MGSESSTAFNEHEVNRSLLAWVDHCALLGPVLDPSVEQCKRFGIEGNASFGAEFAEWDSEPGAVAGVVGDAIEFEIE